MDWNKVEIAKLKSVVWPYPALKIKTVGTKSMLCNPNILYDCRPVLEDPDGRN